jgi:hypothetical protein
MFLEEIQQIEEERNFYYQKLRAIEEECKKRKGPPPASRGPWSQNQPINQEIMAIMMNTPDDFFDRAGPGQQPQ